jgi:hypothetical protein
MEITMKKLLLFITALLTVGYGLAAANKYKTITVKAKAIPQDKFEQIARIVKKFPAIAHVASPTPASALIKKLTGHSMPERIMNQLDDTVTAFEPMSNFKGYLTNDSIENNELFNALYNINEGKKSEHRLFFVGLKLDEIGLYHAFVVEKFYIPNTQPWYRIYLAWKNRCTLGQWLGLTKIQSTTNNDQEMFIADYGKGKKLDKSTLIKFFHTLTKEQGFPCYLTSFKLATDSFDYKLIDKLMPPSTALTAVAENGASTATTATAATAATSAAHVAQSNNSGSTCCSIQ